MKFILAATERNDTIRKDNINIISSTPCDDEFSLPLLWETFIIELLLSRRENDDGNDYMKENELQHG